MDWTSLARLHKVRDAIEEDFFESDEFAQIEAEFKRKNATETAAAR
jgi:hypothetical protein